MVIEGTGSRSFSLPPGPAPPLVFPFLLRLLGKTASSSDGQNIDFPRRLLAGSGQHCSFPASRERRRSDFDVEAGWMRLSLGFLPVHCDFCGRIVEIAIVKLLSSAINLFPGTLTKDSGVYQVFFESIYYGCPTLVSSLRKRARKVMGGC